MKSYTTYNIKISKISKQYDRHRACTTHVKNNKLKVTLWQNHRQNTARASLEMSVLSANTDDNAYWACRLFFKRSRLRVIVSKYLAVARFLRVFLQIMCCTCIMLFLNSPYMYSKFGILIRLFKWTAWPRVSLIWKRLSANKPEAFRLCWFLYICKYFLWIVNRLNCAVKEGYMRPLDSIVILSADEAYIRVFRLSIGVCFIVILTARDEIHFFTWLGGTISK